MAHLFLLQGTMVVVFKMTCACPFSDQTKYFRCEELERSDNFTKRKTFEFDSAFFRLELAMYTFYEQGNPELSWLRQIIVVFIVKLHFTAVAQPANWALSTSLADHEEK